MKKVFLFSILGILLVVPQAVGDEFLINSYSVSGGEAPSAIVLPLSLLSRLASPWQKPSRGIIVNRSYPLARGLKCYWLMNERTGLSVSNHANFTFDDLTGFGIAWSESGILLTSGDYLRVTNANKKELNVGTDDFAFIWRGRLFPTEVTYPCFIQHGATADSIPGYWIHYSNSSETLNIRVGNGSTRSSPSVPFTCDDGQMHTYSFVVSRSRDFIRIYIDGVYKGGLASGLVSGSYDYSGDFYISGMSSVGYEMDETEFCIFYKGRTLSDAEIMRLYREPYAVFQQAR